jgi:hypothetical protein
MRTFLVRLLAVSALALATVTGIGAQEVKQTVTGTVVVAGQDELSIDTPTGRMTFRLDSMLDRTRYNDLKPGTRIEVTHKMDSTGMQHVVTDVNVLSEPSSTYTPPATSTTQEYASNQTSDLPQTASPLWLLGLLGGAALWAGMRKRSKAHKESQPTARKQPQAS